MCLRTNNFQNILDLQVFRFFKRLYHLHKILMNMLALKRVVIKPRNFQCGTQNT